MLLIEPADHAAAFISPAEHLLQPRRLLARKVQPLNDGRDAEGAFVVVFREVDPRHGAFMPLGEFAQSMLNGTLRVHQGTQDLTATGGPVKPFTEFGELASGTPEAVRCLDRVFASMLYLLPVDAVTTSLRRVPRERSRPRARSRSARRVNRGNVGFADGA